MRFVRLTCDRILLFQLPRSATFFFVMYRVPVPSARDHPHQ